jgi:hypothetical protein
MHPEAAWVVAQTSSLLYRGFPIRVLNELPMGPGFARRFADWKSAIQQVGNLRYDHIVSLPFYPCPNLKTPFSPRPKRSPAWAAPR